jgi:peptidase E
MRILAAGGGGFMMEEGVSPLDVYLSRLPAKSKPRICFIPTAGGDLPAHIDRFYEIYDALGCEPSHLPLFRKASHNALDLAKLREQLLRQDLIFAGGGNTKSALAVWREWGVHEALRAAGEAGVILTGMSAGAICWFDTGLTDSFSGSEYQPLQCLGFLPGACNVHYSSDPNRRPSLHKAITAGTIESAIAIDDFAAVLYSGGKLEHVVSWRPEATAYAVSGSPDEVAETAFDAESIAV